MIESEIDHFRGLSPENKEAIAIEAVKTLPAEVVGSLSPENTKSVATAAVNNLGAEGKKDVVAELAGDLSRKDRAELIRTLRPSQPVTDLIWKIIIVSFAVVFVGSSAALIAAALWKPGEIQILLTVVTTIAGFLAGFLSGKSDG